MNTGSSIIGGKVRKGKGTKGLHTPATGATIAGGPPLRGKVPKGTEVSLGGRRDRAPANNPFAKLTPEVKGMVSGAVHAEATKAVAAAKMRKDRGRPAPAAGDAAPPAQPPKDPKDEDTKP